MEDKNMAGKENISTGRVSRRFDTVDGRNRIVSFYVDRGQYAPNLEQAMAKVRMQIGSASVQPAEGEVKRIAQELMDMTRSGGRE